MAKKLVIIEAHKKVGNISKCLGGDYEVIATGGHIADLPEKGLNVDIKKDFEPTYAVSSDKKDIVKTVVEKAKKAEAVYLMTDADREGEAIAWHVSRQLPKNVKYRRVSAQSITKDAIKSGMDQARDIDLKMVASYETRRILDRLVGYKCSYVTTQATGGKSAGRTQSAGLRILAEREWEIAAFKPQVYYPVTVEMLTKKNEKIVADVKLPKPLDIKDEDMAKKIIEKIRAAKVRVSKYEKKNVLKGPSAPFTTSTMYQAASSILNWSTKKTASIAQDLYSAGHITYIRTDSTVVVPEVIAEIRKLASSSYGPNYVPKSPKQYGAAKNAQEAHEACRPYNLSVRTVGSGDEQRLYDMIWRRAVASQMADAEFLAISAEFEADDVLMGASGSKMTFDAWRKVWTYGSVVDKELPEMTEGDVLTVIDVKTERKETKPPPRYSEASFQKKLEDEGIGRPATYASIITTLQDRGYIEGNKSLVVTDLGQRVAKFLIDADFCFVDVKFTSAMETELDAVMHGQKDKVTVLKAFWDRLQKDIANAQQKRTTGEKTKHLCHVCKEAGRTGYFVKRASRFGEFYSCEFYRADGINCPGKADVGEGGEPKLKELVKKEVKYSDRNCPKCGAKLVIRQGRKGEFLGCSKFPKCQGLYDLQGVEIKFDSQKKGRRKWKKKA